MSAQESPPQPAVTEDPHHHSTIYDVTAWSPPEDPDVTAADDIGAVINSIIDDIKDRREDQEDNPSAVIYIPPGDYSLKTRAVIDVSYLQIKGSGHGFASSSIRYNSGDTTDWHEIWPGGSRILVENADGHDEAFLIFREGAPRLASVELLDFCLDGISFAPDQNSYRNGRVGIHAQSDTDSLRIRGIGCVYLEHAVVVHGADALAITDSFIAECGSAVELTGAGQATLVSNNHIGAGHVGRSIFAEGHTGLLVTGNNIFPRGRSSIHLKDCADSAVSANRLSAFYPGQVTLEGECARNLIASNHLARAVEPWPPMQGYDNGLDDLFGMIHVAGDENTISGNHLSYSVSEEDADSGDAPPTIILVKSGRGNYVATNHAVSSTEVNVVVLDASTRETVVLDSAREDQFVAHTEDHSFRAIP